MSTEDKVLPPGKAIKEKNFEVTNLDTTVGFAFNSTSITPLSPIVQTSFNDEGALQVSAIVFIASSIDNPNLDYVSKKEIDLFSGQEQLNFYITYDAEEVSAQEFNAYRMDITVNNPPRNLAQIQTFLWDEDPKTSRGTLTTVEQAS